MASATAHAHELRPEQLEEKDLDRLVPALYADLQRLAHRQLAGFGPRHTLQTTGLVHEAYLRLATPQRAQWQDRGHFFAVASRVMRHVLIDYARSRRAQKRGAGERPLALNDDQVAAQQESERLLALDEGLTRLAVVEPRLARVVECRFFAGLSEDETAEALGLSARTVQRDWARARGWLRREVRR